jgi:hypothetical protein
LAIVPAHPMLQEAIAAKIGFRFDVAVQFVASLPRLE